ncbi:hypothetical protein FIBSPDRAFT_944342 [Athelia psychrophila]|uniref:Uncharacterized protein n=1 Tax=Athelia psychrophila TaxID=1759441 RepID=A0A166V2C0_9AGAM|nr:hypothetical protein FIBSPDRAFT_944342 [Fibularhizoctonia sp. CBS 109695]
MTNHPNFAAANDKYVSTFGDKGKLVLPPAKQLTIDVLRELDFVVQSRSGLGDAYLLLRGKVRAARELAAHLQRFELLELEQLDEPVTPQRPPPQELLRRVDQPPLSLVRRQPHHLVALERARLLRDPLLLRRVSQERRPSHLASIAAQVQSS